MKNLLLSGTMRSGTTLMCSTLDAHPQISMVSDILNWFWSKFFPFYGDITTTYELDKALYELEYYITYGLNKKQKDYFYSKKIKQEIVLNGISSYSLYYVLIKNFYYSKLKQNIGIKATHQAKYYKYFLDYIPNSYVIHMVRNPIDSYYSHKLRTEPNINKVKKIIKNFKTNIGLKIIGERYYYVGLRDYTPYIYKYPLKYFDEWVLENMKAAELSKVFKGRVIIIKYEDFLSNVENTLRNIMQVINVEWSNDILDYNKLKDRNGNPFKANTSFKKEKIVGFAKTQINKNIKKLQKEESNYYFKNVHPFAIKMGYNTEMTVE